MISDTFSQHETSSLLAKSALSGVAASVIRGQTLHSWAALPTRTPRSDKWLTHPTKRTDTRRKKTIGDALWLMIDEKSMLTVPTLMHLSQATGSVRTGPSSAETSAAFGGLNVVLLGDFHQFPPVANSKKSYTTPHHQTMPVKSAGISSSNLIS